MSRQREQNFRQRARFQHEHGRFAAVIDFLQRVQQGGIASVKCKWNVQRERVQRRAALAPFAFDV